MVYIPGGNISEQKQAETLIVGGASGGRIAHMALSKMGKGNTLLVMKEEPTVVCSLPYGIGQRLIPGGPEDVVTDIFRHFAIRSSSHNPDDPFLNLFMQYGLA